jgi:hypothetical protein
VYSSRVTLYALSGPDVKVDLTVPLEKRSFPNLGYVIDRKASLTMP